MPPFNASISTDPFCPPAWRSQRAFDLAETGRPASRMHDDWTIRRLAALLRERRLAARVADLGEARRRDPALADAVDLHLTRGELAAVVRAYLLTSATCSEIAARWGLAAAAVEAYHDSFWDVRDRISRPQFVIGSLILGLRPIGAATPSAATPSAATPSAAAQSLVERAMQLVGYRNSAAALDKLFLAGSPSNENASPCEADWVAASEPLVEALKFIALRQPVLAAEIARFRLLQGERRRDAAQEPQLDSYERNVQEVLKSLNLSCGEPQPGDLSPGLAKFAHCAADLTADEMLYVAQGGVLPYEQELLAAKLPLPRRPEDVAGEARQ